MQTQDIEKLLWEARYIIEQSRRNQGVQNKPPSEKSVKDYKKIAKRVFGGYPYKTDEPATPRNATVVINTVKQAHKESTLRKMARSVRYVAMQKLRNRVVSANQAERAGSSSEVARIVSHPTFQSLLTLSKMLPADYKQDWTPQALRKSKKISLHKLPKDWREKMAEAAPDGLFRLPMLVCLMTGARPAEMEKGVILKREGTKLAAHISGVKVTEHAGQHYRILRIADHPIKELIMKHMDEQQDKNHLMVRVENGNSLTTFMRALGKKLWPRHKEDITAYSARHAMAADCKKASAAGADSDLTSMVLGHRVDKTRTYYGSIFQSGGISVAPFRVHVPNAIKHTSKARFRQPPSQRGKSRPGQP